MSQPEIWIDFKQGALRSLRYAPRVGIEFEALTKQRCGRSWNFMEVLSNLEYGPDCFDVEADGSMKPNERHQQRGHEIICFKAGYTLLACLIVCGLRHKETKITYEGAIDLLEQFEEADGSVFDLWDTIAKALYASGLVRHLVKAAKQAQELLDEGVAEGNAPAPATESQTTSTETTTASPPPIPPMIPSPAASDAGATAIT